MKKYLILSKSVYETKLALLEDNKLDVMYIERNNQKEITGNIYKGKVVDILNNGEIIFLDIGLEKNALLSFENKKNIPKLNIDDKLIVQIETEPRDEKGAKLTLDYSINGENLVLLPKSKNLSISKKIKNIEEVNRLKNIFLNIDNGLILRTDSEGKTEESLLEEYKALKNIENQINREFQNINIGLLYDVNSILKKAATLFDNSIEEFIIDDKTIFEEIKKIWDNKKSFLLLILASFLITGNWLTYIIAVNTNHVLEASFGYYLNPIVTIILAVVFLKEKLTRTQTIACLFVGGSLLYLFISLGSLPWISIMLALTFGLYSLCKKKIILSPKASLLIETAIVSPIAIIYMGYLASNNSVTFHTFGTDTLIYLLLSGVVTAVPLMLFAKGATDIPLYMLGILQYLPPTMQFFIGIFVYGEALSVQKLISFSIIWVAVAVFCYSAILSMKKQNLVSESHKK